MTTPSTVSPDQAARGQGLTLWVILAVILVVGCALRVVSALGDLSIDEIWSLYILDWYAQSRDDAAILVLAGHDNTHPVNTIYMAVVRGISGSEPAAVVYRALSVVAGSLAVVLAAGLALQRSGIEAVFAAMLVAMSYPLIHYSGEARGYALMLTMAIGALWALERWLDTESPSARLWFALCATVGVLSHLMFVLALAALGLMALASGRVGLSGRRVPLGQLVSLFLAPGVVAVGYALYFLMFGIYGNSEPTDVVESAGALAGYSIGTGMPFPYALSLVVFVVLAAFAIVVAPRSPRLVFDSAIIFVVPLVLILADLVHYPQPRYFLLSALFALLAFARLLGWLVNRGHAMRGLAVLLVVAYIGGQVMLLRSFFNDGRGAYGTAVAQMMAVPDADYPVRVGGSQDYRLAMMTGYFARKAGHSDDLIYINDDSSMPLTWYVQEDRHQIGDFPLAQWVDRAGGRVAYELVWVTRPWGLSGQAWALYRPTPRAEQMLSGEGEGGG
ncbi:MAG: glycosyltransferase family 39 protein [Pseudomonadota bacterium]